MSDTNNAMSLAISCVPEGKLTPNSVLLYVPPVAAYCALNMFLWRMMASYKPMKLKPLLITVKSNI
jgi:hypothetical protein